MSLVVSNLKFESAGSEAKRRFTLAFDSSYPTGGESLTAAELGLSRFTRLKIQPESGYTFEVVYSSVEPTSVTIKAFRGGSGTTGAGSAHTHTFTGTAPSTNLDLASPAFSGTGLTAVGQVITTTDNQTMTLNQCAGMWLISATQATPPNLILSNTAVTGAPAVLTVQGSANTDAGAYKIVKHAAPVGTNANESTHTHSISEVAGGEVDNGTDLSGLTAVECEAYGY